MKNIQLASRVTTFTVFITSAILFCCAKPTHSFGATKQVVFDFTGVAQQAIPAVVSIRTKASLGSSSGAQQIDPSGSDIFEFFFGTPKRNIAPREMPIRMAQGSGFIVSPDGLILTNSHVVRDSQEILIKLNDGREFSAKLLGQDANTDIAVLKVDAKNLPYLKLGSSADIEVGQWAIAVGNPFGLQETLTVGVISAKGRANLDVADMEDFIQTDAAINRGNSGGPLLNIDGEVVGMNTAIASSTGGYMGIGFAIPSEMIKYVLDELTQTGTVTRGFLGVVLQPVDYDLAMVFGLDKVEGALVAEVQDGSPAAKAGLRRGDIIIERNGRRVDTVASLRNTISLTKPGQSVTLKVLRDGEPLTITVNVGSKADNKQSKAAEDTTILGIKVEDLTANNARRLGFPQGQAGVVITDIDPNSIAALAGLKKDSIIFEVNRQKINSAEQFHKAVNNIPKGSRVLLLIRQGENIGYLVLTLK